jgi:hypothetical protein
MFIKRDIVERIMSQSGKSRDEVVKLIQEAKKRKEASKSWADYDPDEPFDPSDYPEFFTKRKLNLPPKINTVIGRIDNPILHNKDELYHILIKHLEQYHPEYTKGENLDSTLQHTLLYLQELNNNVPLPNNFKQSIIRFIEQFKPQQQTLESKPTVNIDIHLPDIHQPTPTISEELLTQYIKNIINEHTDILHILTPRHVIKLLEGIFHTNLQNYKAFIKQTIKENLPQTPRAPTPRAPTPRAPTPQAPTPLSQTIMEELFGQSPKEREVEEDIEIERKSPKQRKSKVKSTKRVKKSKSVKRKSVKKSKSVKRKSVKKSKSVKRKSVKKSKSKKRKSVKKSKSKKSKSVKRKSKKSKSVKRKSKKSKSKKSKSVKRKSKKSKSKKSKSVKRKSKKSKSVKRKSKKSKSVKKSKSKKTKSKK